MSRVKVLGAFTLLVLFATGNAEAQSLRLSPVTIDLAPGEASSVFTLDTDKTEGVAVQARVFRWSQVGGEDKLEKTADVIVSPPVLTVKSGSSSTIRLLRVAAAPVVGEETYRVEIEEIPDRKSLQAGKVALVVRQSVPVFFSGLDQQAGSVTWRAVERKGGLVLEARNSGQRRVKLWKLRVIDEKKRDLVKMDGLSGYVLGGQAKAWVFSGQAGAKSLTIKAESDVGPINASITVGGSG